MRFRLVEYKFLNLHCYFIDDNELLYQLILEIY